METLIRLFELCYDWIAYGAFIFMLAAIGVIIVFGVISIPLTILKKRKRSK